MIVFEVHLTPGSDDSELLSAQIRQETMAQVMTTTEAKAVGFDGFGDDPNLRLVAVTEKDKGWVEKALERAPNITGYRAHQVDT